MEKRLWALDLGLWLRLRLKRRKWPEGYYVGGLRNKPPGGTVSRFAKPCLLRVHEEKKAHRYEEKEGEAVGGGERGMGKARYNKENILSQEKGSPGRIPVPRPPSCCMLPPACGLPSRPWRSTNKPGEPSLHDPLEDWLKLYFSYTSVILSIKDKIA